ncbi:MAG: tryptophan-rich sensory protein [Methanomicrobiales archaeon]|nr:tryptophan-rich sensory protein [Methanomicrobiales archaeon]
MASTGIRIIQFIAAIGVSLAAGWIGSIFTIPALSVWYAGLMKPALTPPSWVFAPVWTVLYILMGVALYLVWSKGWGNRHVQVATALFGMQLILNILWSFVFFGMHAPFFGFIVILLLWIAIFMTIVSFNRISVPAAVLLVPYFLWVSFAAFLNHGIYVLNP